MPESECKWPIPLLLDRLLLAVTLKTTWLINSMLTLTNSWLIQRSVLRFKSPKFTCCWSFLRLQIGNSYCVNCRTIKQTRERKSSRKFFVLQKIVVKPAANEASTAADRQPNSTRIDLEATDINLMRGNQWLVSFWALKTDIYGIPRAHQPQSSRAFVVFRAGGSSTERVLSGKMYSTPTTAWVFF